MCVKQSGWWKQLAAVALALCVEGGIASAQEPTEPDPTKKPEPPRPVSRRKEREFNMDGRFEFLTPKSALLNDPGEHGKAFGELKKILSGELSLREYDTNLVTYYKDFMFPLMTIYEETDLPDLPRKRDQFLRNHLGEFCKSGDAHQRLVDLTFTEMRKIAGGNYHPAVRYNALYIIAQLNMSESVKLGGAKAVPDPYSPALPVLLDEFKKEETPEALKVAALLGMIRHLEWDNYRSTDRKIAAAQRTEVLNTLIALINTPKPPETRSPAAQNWLRRRAIDGLGFAGYLVADPNIVQLLTEVVSNDKEDLAVRVDAAEALGKVNLAPPVKVDVPGMVENLSKLALTVCQNEVTRLDELQKNDHDRVATKGNGLAGSTAGTSYPMATGSSGSGGRRPSNKQGADLPPPEDYKKYRVELTARRIRASLQAIDAAIESYEKVSVKKHEIVPYTGAGPQPVRGLENIAKPAAGAKPPADPMKKPETPFTKLQLQIKEMERFVETQDLDHYVFKREIKDPMRGLVALVKVNAPAAKDPEPGAAEDEPELPKAPGKAPAVDPAGKAPAEDAPAAAPAKPAAKPAAKVEDPAEEPEDAPAAAPKKAPAKPPVAAP